MLALSALFVALAAPQATRPAPPPPPSQDLTLPPETASTVTILEGRGVQIYTCQSTPVGFHWTLKAPEAQLFNLATGKPAGHHDAGPTWTSDDGSAIQGTVVHTRPGATPADVPWLLLQAVPRPDAAHGTLDTVHFVRRYNTHGGAPPPTGCNQTTVGAEQRVPYSASYAFYATPGTPSVLLISPGPAPAPPPPPDTPHP